MEKIRIQGVRKTFRLKRGQSVTVQGKQTDELEVLGGVDLSMREGEFVTLVGPSGCGKSVLLDMIGGLAAPSAGAVYIDGEAIAKPGPKTAYVFQQYALFPWRNALSNVEYALEVRGVSKNERTDKAKYLLGLFGLAAFGDRYPNQLSGGMQQRVAIARALANKPELLLADEPTGALDSRTGDAILGLFDKLHRERGVTLIVVTHSEAVAAAAERVFWMRDGQETKGPDRSK